MITPVAVLLMAGILVGCGGGRLIPRDLKDFVAAHLKTPRRNVELTRPFRTTVTLRVERMTIEEARRAERDIIDACLQYFRRDNVSNFINDTLVFQVRLSNDADINLKYYTVSGDMRQLVDGDMSMDRFIERCNRIESWSADL